MAAAAALLRSLRSTYKTLSINSKSSHLGYTRQFSSNLAGKIANLDTKEGKHNGKIRRGTQLLTYATQTNYTWGRESQPPYSGLPSVHQSRSERQPPYWCLPFRYTDDEHLEGAEAGGSKISEVAAKILSSVVCIEAASPDRNISRISVGSGFINRHITTISIGSGFIVEESGIIVTCHHVIKGSCGRPRVSLEDGRGFDALVLTEDEVADIATLKITSEVCLPKLNIAQAKPRLGEHVIAIGHSVGNSHRPRGSAVTKTIVSYDAKIGRISGMPEQSIEEIDYAISMGPWGGPLINKDGEVMGMVNDGFSIPLAVLRAEVAKAVVISECVKACEATDSEEDVGDDSFMEPIGA